MQGCSLDPKGCTLVSLCFKAKGGELFYIPRPFGKNGYTVSQIAKIEAEIAWLDLELLPLDHILH